MAFRALDRLRPGEHACWGFDDRDAFEVGARRFLAAGAARGEKTMLIDRDEAAAVYGADADFDPMAAVAMFGTLAADARRDGYRGLRAAADLTLVAHDPRLTEQLGRYEHLIDRFLRVTGVATGLCGYDTSIVDPSLVRDLAVLHTHASPDPRFHLCATPADGLSLSGELDAATMDALRRALDRVQPERDTPIVELDVSGLAFVDHRSLLALDELASTFGGAFMLEGARPIVRRLVDELGCEHLLVKT